NGAPSTACSALAKQGISSFSNTEADLGARTMLLALRSLAKNLRAIPGRKMVVLISAGFPLSPERESELTATIDACTKSNVAIYPVDARGLMSGMPKMSRNFATPNLWHSSTPRLVLASYPEPQKPGGGGGPGGGAGGGTRGGSAGGRAADGGSGGGGGGAGGGGGGAR